MIAALQVSLDGFIEGPDGNRVSCPTAQILRNVIHPIVLGKGQTLFGGVNERLLLDLVEA
jgi:hypothetical protein